MLNNKESLQSQQFYLLPLKKKIKSPKKNHSLQLSRLKLSITKKFKQNFIKSISKINLNLEKIQHDLTADEELQKYKRKSLLFQQKALNGYSILNSSSESNQIQKTNAKNISNLKIIRKKALQRVILETQLYYKKMSPQKFDQIDNPRQKSDLQKRKRGNINQMLKKCQRQKEINKFENDLINSNQPSGLLPIRFLTEPIHARQPLKTCILKHQKMIKEEYSPSTSSKKMSRQSQLQMTKTIQNFKFIHCINIEKAMNMKKLKKIRINSPSKEDGAQPIVTQFKKSMFKQNIKRHTQGSSDEIKNYHTTQFISPWIEEYVSSPRYIKKQ